MNRKVIFAGIILKEMIKWSAFAIVMLVFVTIIGIILSAASFVVALAMSTLTGMTWIPEFGHEMFNAGVIGLFVIFGLCWFYDHVRSKWVEFQLKS